jgi:MarR family transcriptional regulator for hemolysin
MYSMEMEIKKTEICLGHSIRKADRVISQIYNDYLAPVGLRGTQFSVLRALVILGSGVTAANIRDALVMDQTTISRALKPLVRDGLIEISEGANKREKALSLSRSGKALYEKALVPWNQAQKKVRQSLGKAHTDNLIELTREIVGLKQ